MLRFVYVHAAWGFVLFPLFALGYLGYRRWQDRAFEVYAESGVRPLWLREPLPLRWRLRRWLLWMWVMSLLVLGGMRPQWLPYSIPTVTPAQWSLYYILDASLSMHASDSSPSRLAVAKRIILEVQRRLDAVPAGLVIFEQEARMICPPTLDAWALAQAVESVRVKSLSKHGTQLEAALSLVQGKLVAGPLPGRPSAVVVFSDGEMNRGGDPERVALELGGAHVPVFCVGVGSIEGAAIPLGVDFWGKPQYRMHHGQRVITRLCPDVLERIARKGGGEYWPAGERSNEIPERLTRALQKHAWLNIPPSKTLSLPLSGPAAPIELFPWCILAALLGWGLEWWVRGRGERWLP